MSDIQLPVGWKVLYDKNTNKNYYYNIFTKQSQWNVPGSTNPLSDWEEKISKSTGAIYYYNTKTGESSWKIPIVKDNSIKCSNIRGLKWKGNSCYIDSTLVALFSTPCQFTDNILNMNLSKNPISRFVGGSYPCGMSYDEDLQNRQMVQNQLNIIAQSIRGSNTIVEYCFNLRETFRRCPDPENYYDNRIKDAGEFLGYILSLFPVNTAVKRRQTYATNDMSFKPSFGSLIETSDITDRNSSIIHQVDSFRLLALKGEKTGLNNFIKQREDTYPNELAEEDLFFPNNGNIGYKRRITYETLVSAPYIVFSLKRVNIFTNFINTEIIPVPEITLKSGERFFLSAIVIFENLHYTCTFLCENTWYYYNDMDSTKYYIQRIGTYNDMLKIRPSPMRNGTQYYYTPV